MDRGHRPIPQERGTIEGDDGWPLALRGPVVLVGPACHTALLPGEAGRMVVCSDNSEFSETVIPVASAWATDLGLQPWLVEVVSPDEVPAPPEQPARNREEEAAQQRLERLGAHVDNPELTPRIEVLHGQPASRSIADFATELPASLIAMATHGRAGLARTALGSVATEVIRRAPCPVLAVRPDLSGEGRARRDDRPDAGS